MVLGNVIGLIIPHLCRVDKPTASQGLGIGKFFEIIYFKNVSHVVLAVLSQLKRFTFSYPNRIFSPRKFSSKTNLFIASPISCGLSGFTRIAPLPAISGLLAVLEVTTGVPAAWASRIGNPKP